MTKTVLELFTAEQDKKVTKLKSQKSLMLMLMINHVNHLSMNCLIFI